MQQYGIKKIENSSKYVKHFGILINSEKTYLKINRDEYARIDKKNHSLSISKKEYEKMKQYRNSNDTFRQNVSNSYFKNYLKVYEDDTLTRYTDEYCIKHQQKSLVNYDLNMNFFSKIKYADFEKVITRLKKKFKKLVEITDLSDYGKKSGVYILILDAYKQVYVGQTSNIKKRISQHWRDRKEFSKLIFGNVETSVLSIDSFGALDTTRILVYETDSKYNQIEVEEEITNYIPKKYLLNRTKGGDRGFLKDEIIVNSLGTMNKRQLK